jgi:hypothetical protein
MTKKRVVRTQIGNVFLVLYAFNELERRMIEEEDNLKILSIKADEWFRFHAERDLDHELSISTDKKDLEEYSRMLKIYTNRWGETEFYRDISKQYDSIKRRKNLEEKRRVAYDKALEGVELDYEESSSNLCGYLRINKSSEGKCNLGCALRNLKKNNLRECDNPSQEGSKCKHYLRKFGRPVVNNMESINPFYHANISSNRI